MHLKKYHLAQVFKVLSKKSVGMRWCALRIKLSLVKYPFHQSLGLVNHNLVVSTITKSSSSRSYWFVSDGMEFIDVAIDVAVFRLFILLNLLISEVLSANVSIKTKTVLK
jgi:hypothetical protein